MKLVNVYLLRTASKSCEFRNMPLLQSSVRSHGPDTRDVWTDTESDDVSDSGIQSLPSSDGDVGINDIKMVSLLYKLSSV